MNWGRFRTVQMVAALGHWPEAVRYRTHFHPNSLLLTNYCHTYNRTRVDDPHRLDADADIPLFTLIRTQFRLFTLIADLDPDPASHQSWCESATTSLQILPGTPRLQFEPLQLLNSIFGADPDPDPSFSYADPACYTIQGCVSVPLYTDANPEPLLLCGSQINMMFF